MLKVYLHNFCILLQLSLSISFFIFQILWWTFVMKHSTQKSWYYCTKPTFSSLIEQNKPNEINKLKLFFISITVSFANCTNWTNRTSNEYSYNLLLLQIDSKEIHHWKIKFPSYCFMMWFLPSTTKD